MRHLLRAFVALASCLYASSADACSCISSGPPCQNLFQSEAVFAGTVTGIQPLEPPVERFVFDRRVVAFKVERAVRGIQGHTVDVRTGQGGGDCGFNFKIGERYVVYAYRHPDGSPGTGICSRTRLVTEAAEDLAYFAALPATGAGARMFGTVKHWEHDPATRSTVQHGPVADVQVLLRGPRGTYSAMSDTAGKYSIAGIPVGAYELEVLPPAAFSVRATHRKIEFTDPRACRAEDISLRYDGRIIGMLLDASGLPAPGVRLDIVAAEHPREPPSFYIPNPVTDGSGRFELVEVPSGRYLLAVGLTLPMNSEISYPTTFYPGTPTLERAGPIEVGAAHTYSSIRWVCQTRWPVIRSMARSCAGGRLPDKCGHRCSDWPARRAGSRRDQNGRARRLQFRRIRGTGVYGRRFTTSRTIRSAASFKPARRCGSRVVPNLCASSCCHDEKPPIVGCRWWFTSATC